METIKRVGLVAEAVLLLVLAGLLTRVVLSLAGVDAGVAEDALFHSDPPDWLTAAGAEAGALTMKWGGLLLFAYTLARCRGYSIFRPVEKEPAHKWTLREKLLLGLAVGIPLQFLATLPRWIHFYVMPLGETPAIWNLIYFADWTPEFWFFMAIGSFALVPVVEELYFRGFFFGGLLRHFSVRSSVLISAVLFAAVHLQYLGTDFLSLFNSGMVLVSAATVATIVYLTRSLVPAVAAHAYSNIPHPLTWVPFEVVLLVPAIALLVRFWPKLRRQNVRDHENEA